jgi:hypothetical protein
MRFRERSRRNLGAGTGSAEEEASEHKQNAEEVRRVDGPDTSAFIACDNKRHLLPPSNDSWRANAGSLIQS